MTAAEQAAIQAIVDAWTVEGPRPDIHRAAQDRLTGEWPTLARAINQLLVAEGVR